MRASLLVLAFTHVLLGCRSTRAAVSDEVARPLKAAAVSRPECAIYAVLLDTVYPNAATKPPVLMDSTFERVYQRAFNAWTTRRPPTTGPGAEITQVTLDSLRSLNLARFPLPTCPELAAFGTIPSDSLRALFSGPERSNGWERFYARHPSTAGFTGLSRIAFNSDSTEAIAYVAHHAEWLNGHGSVFRLRRTDGKWLITDRRVVWMS